MRRPPRPQYNDRYDVDKHHDDEGGNDNDDHSGAVETNAGERYRADYHLAPFDNTMIRYVVEVMV